MGDLRSGGTLARGLSCADYVEEGSSLRERRRSTGATDAGAPDAHSADSSIARYNGLTIAPRVPVDPSKGGSKARS